MSNTFCEREEASAALLLVSVSPKELTIPFYDFPKFGKSFTEFCLQPLENFVFGMN